MSFAIPAINKDFWTGYVTTALDEAGHFLHAKPNEQVRDQAVKGGFLDGKFRPIVFNYTDNSWHMFNSRTTTVISPPPSSAPTREKTDKERLEERAQTMRWVGTVITVGAAFLAGLTYKSYTRQNETARLTKHVEEQSRNLPEPIRGTIRSLIFHQIEMDNINTSRVSNYFYAAMGTLVGGSALAIGGFCVVSWLMTAGQVVLLASAVLAAANLGLHWSDNDDLRKHHIAIAGNATGSVQGYATTALLQLRQFQNDMRSSYVVPPQSPGVPADFQPMYPDYFNAYWAAPAAYNSPIFGDAAAPSAPPMDQ